MTETIIGTIDKLAPALAKTQGELTNPPKTKTANAGKYKYRYADLAEIIDHVRPVLATHGLSIVQMIESGEKNTLKTRLMHESGQWLESTYPLPLAAAAQEMGSAITYARRYSLCAILGIAAEEDDDGVKANQVEAGEAIRNELIEIMCRDSIGNKALMDYCRANKLGDGRTVEDLDLPAVKKLVDEWADVVEAIKKPVAPKANPEKKPEAPPAEPSAPPPEPPNRDTKYDGVDLELADMLRAEGLTPDQLHAYYVSAGHLTEKVTPDKLPTTYLSALKQPKNWTKAVQKMKEIQ